jgi:hypothetical protein
VRFAVAMIAAVSATARRPLLRALADRFTMEVGLGGQPLWLHRP